MTPQQIQALRHALNETASEFSARFRRSPRTVENWEQGTRKPDPLVLAMLKELAAKQKGGPDKKQK